MNHELTTDEPYTHELANIAPDDLTYLRTRPPESKTPYNIWPARMPWGKYKKKLLSVVPTDYLQWVLEKLMGERMQRSHDEGRMIESTELETQVATKLKTRRTP